MIEINSLVDHIKARLGASHRRLELDDEAIIQCLQDETLKTLSIYHPYYCQTTLNLGTSAVMEGMNTYYIPTRLGDDFDVMGVEVMFPMSTSTVANNTFYMPGGNDLQSLISSLSTGVLSNTLSGAAVNPTTFTFMAPNMIRLHHNLSSKSVMLVLRTTHKRDFSTFPYGLMETVKQLAFYDVAMDIFSIRRFFSNTQTMFAQINLDMDLYNQIPDRRTELVEKMRNEQLKYSNTRKIYLA